MTPELLAPAGNLNTALAAFDAGADAVYAGLKHFNARERGDNFTPDEMSRLVYWAHRNRKKVYLTFNTLLRDSELPEAADALAELDQIQPDALIVQDIGTAAIIRRFFPGLKIHASTQMAIHNLAGIQTAAEIGCSRVILERETTLEEIQKIAERSPLEIEVFIHGALCCSLSGTCLLSSYLYGGDASGNRGKCRQPCRALYRDASGKKGFFLSTRDLCGIDLIPAFRKMGIASFKIEGRLRKADYVSETVRAYRLVLDHPDDPEAGNEAIRILNHTCTRERSCGYYSADSARSLIRSDAPGGIGQIRGRVIRTGHGFFEAQLTGSIHIGDNLRVQTISGDDAQAFTLLNLSVNRENMEKAPAGVQCRIGCPGRIIPNGGILYRIGETTDRMEKRIRNLPAQKPQLPLALTLDGHQFHAEVSGKIFQKTLLLEPAQKHPVTEEELSASFAGIGELPFFPFPVSSRISGTWFLPASVLKELRRSFREWAVAEITAETFRQQSMDRAKRLLAAADSMLGTAETQIPSDGMELPFFTPETEWHTLEEQVRKALSEGTTVFLASNLSHFQLKKKFPEITLKTAPPLPVSNAFAAEEAARLGVSAVHAHVELPPEEIKLLKQHSPVPVELWKDSPVLLATRAGVKAKGFLLASNGKKIRIEQRNGFTCLIGVSQKERDPLKIHPQI